ncbi:ABC transporter permease [Microvirga mediterraneensis]|uniref:MlaE family lipid ABC transporter permease subunit n=1 Tax=Microvirga mediterraneensis TaxID=2754695 RepID=A0A838BU54_9HYPH|nr:MlaE family lipid ABC transporter permease subunit [Microvirga mediterraneensis]MBA1158800.1 MlaE family lipid ABC transporter permease subunit [Microvirga mediterraneensis]
MTLEASVPLHDPRDSALHRHPKWKLKQDAKEPLIELSGNWSAEQASAMEIAVADLITDVKGARATFDLSGVERLDTVGAWLLDRTRHDLRIKGCTLAFENAREEHGILLDEVDHYDVPPEAEVTRHRVFDLLDGLGHAVLNLGRDLLSGLAFLGEFMMALGRVVTQPRRFRGTSLVNQLDFVALRSVPIMALISLLVGGIIAQQGIFQLRQFGASAFVVDLVGILVLRELGVLLTAIMIAGRSGSAFTAELGSMKMREEIDAIRVMGLDPMEVLIIPRLLALIIGLPMLTFLSDLSALFGGGLVAWLYEGIGPRIFMSRLKEAIALNTFLVGMIKAPFMALIIGMIASIEGLAVQGSAESLGRHVTSSVVKAIFMVIVADGLFAMFFAAIKY